MLRNSESGVVSPASVTYRAARYFLPRWMCEQTCGGTLGTGDNSAALSKIQETLTNTGDRLETGHSDILKAIAGAGTCDLTSLENGQTTIREDLANTLTELAQLDDILTATTSDVSKLSTQIDTTKTMILEGQTTVNNNIADLASEVTNLTTLLGERIEITDRLEAIDAKLDSLIKIMMEARERSSARSASQSRRTGENVDSPELTEM